MSYRQDKVRREAIASSIRFPGESLERGELFRFARRHHARSVSDLVRRIGLEPDDFAAIELSEETVAERASEFVRTGQGIGRLRLWVGEMAGLCLVPTYLKSSGYRPPVDRGIRLLRLILDPILLSDRECARRLTGYVLGYLLAGAGTPGPRVIGEILRAQRELSLVTYRRGVPDLNWADVALVARAPGRKRASWFVPLTIVTGDCSCAPHPGASLVELPDRVASANGGDEEILSLEGPASGGRDFRAARVYDVPGRARARLLAHFVDADGLACVKCWTDALDRGDLRLAASVFCVANKVAKARLDGEPLETSLA